MLTRFQKYITQNKLIARNDKILLAVSGGIDSMVMLDMFLRSGYRVAVAHCNFSLRGEESDADQALVEWFARDNNVELFVRRFETTKEAADSGESIQMAARRLRYAWFEELCDEHNFDRIAIAHHCNDSAETFFINLIRGTGLRGLTGISVVSGKIIRPFTFATSDQIAEYARENSVEYRNDSTNSQTKYLRNWIRHDIIPRFCEKSEGFLETMAQNLSRLEQAQLFIDGRIEEIKKEAIRDNNIDVKTLKSYGNTNFVLFEILHPYGFAPEVINDLAESLDASGKTFFAHKYKAVVDRDRIIIEMRDKPQITEQKITENDPRIEWVDVSGLTDLRTPTNVALLSVDSAKFPLILRKWKQGDTFMPLGMNGTKKVSDFLIDAKVSLPEKDIQCVLESQGEIMWLVGRRIDDRYKVTEKSKKVIKIEL